MSACFSSILLSYNVWASYTPLHKSMLVQHYWQERVYNVYLFSRKRVVFQSPFGIEKCPRSCKLHYTYKKDVFVELSCQRHISVEKKNDGNELQDRICSNLILTSKIYLHVIYLNTCGDARTWMLLKKIFLLKRYD